MHPKFIRRAVLAAILLGSTACDRQSAVSLAPDESADAARRAPAVDVSRTGGLRLSPGDTTRISANGLISRARVVRWSSSDEQVATVSGSGLVKALRLGTAQITVRSSAGTENTTLSVVERVEATAPIAAVEIQAMAASVIVGAQLNLTAVGRDAAGQPVAGGAVTWSRLSGSAATISAAGLLTAVSSGAVTIRATIDGVSGDRTFTVTTPVQDAPAPTVTAIEVAPSQNVQLTPRATQQFSAAALWSNGTTSSPAVVWSTSRGTITTTGRYTAPSTTGTTRIIARLSGGTMADTVFVTVAVTAPTVTAFAVSPKTGTTLAAGATRQFSTSVNWSDGATRSIGVTYSASGGTISSSGLFTAGQLAGSFLVIANCACGRADTALVAVSSVTTPPAQLTKLTISPQSVTLQPGASYQFSVSANWSTGATTVPPVTYSYSGGTMSPTGNYTAPTVAGTYGIIVAHTNGTLRDTAMVIVQGTVTSPPPPPVPTAFTPNLPANEGLTLVRDVSLGNLVTNEFNADGLRLENGDPMNGYGRTIIDTPAPFGPKVYEHWYPGGHTGNGYGGGRIEEMGRNKYKKLYFAMHAWVQADYVTHSVGEKWLYLLTSNAAGTQGRNVSVNWDPIYSLGDTPTGPTFGFTLWIPGHPTAGLSQGVQQTAGFARFRKGRWVLLEGYVKMNDPNTNNAEMRIWVDGAIAHRVSDFSINDGPQQTFFDGIRFDGTRGGGTSSVPNLVGGQAKRYSRLVWYGAH